MIIRHCGFKVFFHAVNSPVLKSIWIAWILLGRSFSWNPMLRCANLNLDEKGSHSVEDGSSRRGYTSGMTLQVDRRRMDLLHVHLFGSEMGPEAWRVMQKAYSVACLVPALLTLLQGTTHANECRRNRTPSFFKLAPTSDIRIIWKGLWKRKFPLSPRQCF